MSCYSCWSLCLISPAADRAPVARCATRRAVGARQARAPEDIAPARISESVPVEISESVQARISESAPARISESEPLRTSESAAVRISESAAVRISETAPRALEDRRLRIIRGCSRIRGCEHTRLALTPKGKRAGILRRG